MAMPKKYAQTQKKQKLAAQKRHVTEAIAASKKTFAEAQSPFLTFSFRATLLLICITLVMFFYPGNNYYTEMFAFHADLFKTPLQRTDSYEVTSVPYIQPGTPSPFVTAASVYVIDLVSTTPLFDKNPHMKLYPASTVKVMTALTAQDVFSSDDVLTVKRVINEGQVMDLVKGERITYENLLYGLLVHSGNDAAYVIADNYPEGYDAFIAAMNDKAASLGMKNSRFHNPAGLDNSGQYVSAFDLTLAGRELLKNPQLSKIVSTKSITVSDVDYMYFHPLYNVNRLLGEIPGVAGLKTGKTELAGENLITLYKKNGRQYLIVLLKSEDRFIDTQSIVQWLDQNVRYQEL